MESFNVQLQATNTHPGQQDQALSYQRLDKKLRFQPQDSLSCPRCESTNTKFCYYNNYSLSQPRYFCRGCRRYWTHGGSLRNVPVGGGCRKNRRTPSSRRNTDQYCLTTAGQLSLGDHHHAAAGTVHTENPKPSVKNVTSSFLDLLMGGILETNIPEGYQGLNDGAQMPVPFGEMGGEDTYRNMLDLQWQVDGDVNYVNGNENLVTGMKWGGDGCFGGVGSSWHGLVDGSLL